jgi:hypothetical protein
VNLRAVAAGQVQSVVEEATEAARRQAVEILTARLTELIIEEAAGSERSLRPPADAPEPAAAECGWYLYGLTWPWVAAAMSGSEGLAGTPLRAVPLGDVAAVVSPVEDERRWGIGDGGDIDLELLAPRVADHQRVLEEILERGPVLPLRFGVMYPELSVLIEALESGLADVARELRRLDGMVEWGLTIEWGGLRAARLEAVPSESGRQYLSRRQQDRAVIERAQSDALEAAGIVHGALLALACDAVVHPSRGPVRTERSAILRASYLVDRCSIESFRAAAGQALAAAPPELGLSGELTGPWPAYHFVDVHLGEAV